MSVNKYDSTTGTLTTLATGDRTWVGTKAAYDAQKQAGTLPNDCLIVITDDEVEMDTVPTEDSPVAVTSGGLYDFLTPEKITLVPNGSMTTNQVVCIKIGNVCYINGYCACPITGTETIFTVPAKYRPSTVKYIGGVVMMSSSTTLPGWFGLKTDGSIYQGATAGAITQCVFSGWWILD